MSLNVRYVGLDVHKHSITIAVAEPGDAPATVYRQVPNDWNQLLKALRRLSPMLYLKCCYEAGPTGYGLYCQMKQAGIDCIVVAPSQVPKQAGNRIKTDRRDAVNLATYLRGGSLKAVYVPDEAAEALRDLSRAREDAKNAERVARHQLDKFLLRNDRRYDGRTLWTQAHRQWIRRQKFAHAAQTRVLNDYLKQVEDAAARIEALTRDLEELVPHSPLAPLITALQAFRGIRLVTAVVIASELGDLRRFKTPRELMAYLGLVPSQYSTGVSRRLGGITRTGNGHVRRILVESAWNYQFQPNMSREIRLRNQGVSVGVQRIAWKAQQRLHKRLYALRSRGKNTKKAIIAVARELAGFIWAAAQQPQLLAEPSPAPQTAS
jgi:transposase